VSIVAGVAYVVVFVFFIFLLVRLVLDWVQYFAREWRPSGISLVIAEVTYSVTDPPLKALRRLIPPLSLGAVRLDLGFLILMLACLFLLRLLGSIAGV